MARISGINLPDKRVEYALCYIHGIGITSARLIVKNCNIDPQKRSKDLTDDEISKIRDEIQNSFVVEGELRKKVAMDIKRMMDMGSYKGIRHRKRLPVRGQRTHTNARTRRGKAVPIAGKKLAKAKK